MRTPLLMVVVLVGSGPWLELVRAADHEGFSGEWVLNREKSDTAAENLGPLPGGGTQGRAAANFMSSPR